MRQHHQQPRFDEDFKGMRGFRGFNRLMAGHRRNNNPYDDINLEDWDFSKTSRADAKLFARTFISTAAIAIFVYFTIAFAIFSAIFLCLLKRAATAAEVHEAQQAIFRPRHHHHHNHQVVSSNAGQYAQHHHV
jgi:hypothetical protein